MTFRRRRATQNGDKSQIYQFLECRRLDPNENVSKLVRFILKSELFVKLSCFFVKIVMFDNVWWKWNCRFHQILDVSSTFFNFFASKKYKNDVIFKVTSRIWRKYCLKCQKQNLKMLGVKYVFCEICLKTGKLWICIR